jgi:hypothetical protein
VGLLNNWINCWDERLDQVVEQVRQAQDEQDGHMRSRLGVRGGWPLRSKFMLLLVLIGQAIIYYCVGERETGLYRTSRF